MAHIFVIDDEPILLDLISTVLQLDGHEVKTLADPVAAYDAMIVTQPPIDLLITDADMTPISGFQLVQRLRKERVNCPAIFMSGHHGLAAIITESFEQPAVMEKPFTAPELRAAVQKALAGDSR